MNLFISYKFNSPEDLFVERVVRYLKTQSNITVQRFPDLERAGELTKQIQDEIISSDIVIFIWGNEIGEIQEKELIFADVNNKRIIPVWLPNKCEYVENKVANTILINIRSLLRVEVRETRNDQSALKAAENIVNKIPGCLWVPYDGLPVGYPFEYEKDIIREYINGNGELSVNRVREGCPQKWPEVEFLGENREENFDNPVSEEEIGAYRDWNEENGEIEDSKIIPVALSDYHQNDCCPHALELTFSEAGPRKKHYYPNPLKGNLKVAILVSGGIAPGINAVISGIIKRQVLYAENGRWGLDENGNRIRRQYNLTICGYPEGFKPLISRGRGGGVSPDALTIYSTEDNGYSKDFLNFSYSDKGGSILPTSRMEILNNTLNPTERSNKLRRIIDSLDDDEIDILYVIGGDGSMKAAHAIWNYAKKYGQELSVIAIPKTMDNDILWVWQSFGFLSAVEWAKSAIRQLYQEARSNPRVSVIQLFGSDSGFVVSHAALASGVCDLALIPEIEFNMEKIAEYVTETLQKRFIRGVNGSSPHFIVLMAENAIPRDAVRYLDSMDVNLSVAEKEAVQTFIENGHRVKGKTPNELRTAGLKIVSKILEQKIRKITPNNSYWSNFEVFTNEPRHLIRSIPPSSSDIIYGERLGMLAVDSGMAGYTDFMISQWLTEYVMVPLKLVVLGRKRVPTKGIFWKSVIAKTNQPATLM